MIDCRKCIHTNCEFNILVPKKSCEMYEEKISDTDAIKQSIRCLEKYLEINERVKMQATSHNRLVVFYLLKVNEVDK